MSNEFPVRTMIDDPYTSLRNSNTKYTSTGINTLDEAINGLETKTVIVITGRPSEGKSTFAHNMLLNAINDNKKVLLVDGEHNKDDLYNNLFRKVIGADDRLYDKIQCFKKVRKEPKPHIQEQLTNWFGRNLMVVFKDEMKLGTFDLMFEMMKNFCIHNDVSVVFLDNLMSLITSSQAEIFAKQSDFMKKCTSLAKSANVAVVLISHPNGTAPKGKEIDYYQISGSSDIPNLADVIIQIIKDPTDEEDVVLADGRAVVLKNRKYSMYPKVNLAFDFETMALYEVNREGIQGKSYNWRKEGKQEWLDKKAPF